MSNIKKFHEFVNDNTTNSKVEENLDVNNPEENTEDNFPYVNLFIADEVAKGFTNGIVNDKDGAEIEWDLEVNVKDWINMDDEDIDYLADELRAGKTEGNDPLDWKLVFGGDSFEEEEEDYTRADVANELEIDADELEDSADLGDIADKLNSDKADFDLAKDEAEELLDAYQENRDISKYFTKFIGKNFHYNKVEAMYNDVVEYYKTSFEDEYGYLTSFDTKFFNMALRELIGIILGTQVDEKKSTEKEKKAYHFLLHKGEINMGEINGGKKLDKKKYAIHQDKEDLKKSDILKKFKEKGYEHISQISKDSYEDYKKYLTILK